MRRQCSASALGTLVRQACAFMGRAEEHGRRAGGTLLQVPGELVDDLCSVATHIANKFNFCETPDLDEQLERQRPGFWLSALIVHGWALRDMIALLRRPESFERDLQIRKCASLLSTLPWLLSASNVLIPPSKHSKGLLLAILDSDTFACYSAIFAGIYDLPHAELERYLTMYLFLLMVISHSGRAATGTPITEGQPLSFFLKQHDTARFNAGLYGRWIRALLANAVLEHSARALLRLQASAQAAVAAGTPQVLFLRDRLGDARGHLAQVVYRTVDPHLSQPILSLCPRPLATAERSADPAVCATLPMLRELLSGTCIQFWLGRELVEARLRFTGGVGTLQGLPATLLLPAPLQMQGLWNNAVEPAYLLRHMDLCTTVWQVTVSGPRPPRPRPGLLQPWPPAAAATMSLPPSMPYSAVNVFELAHEAFWCIAQRASGPYLAGSVEYKEVVNMARLLVRLIAELDPRHSRPRLPSLWRSMTRVLAVITPSDIQLFHTFVRTTCTLLQQELATATEPAPQQPQHQGSGVAGAGADDDLLGCSFSLRCALDGGLLPSLEEQMRRSYNLNEGPTACITLVTALLRYSAVWPAVLAHGSVKEAASLIATIRKLAVAFIAVGSQGPLPTLPGMERIDPTTAIAGQWISCLMGLMEQVAAAMSPPSAPPTRSHAGNRSAASSSSSSRPVGRQAGSASRPSSSSAATAADSLLPLNDALEPNETVHVCLDWIERAGGRPAAGSPASEQQLMMAMYAGTQWLPVATQIAPTGWWWSGELVHAVGHWVLAMTQQCLLTGRRMEEARVEAHAAPPRRGQQGAGGAAQAGCSSGEGNGSGGGGSSRDNRVRVAEMAFLSWRRFLLDEVHVILWLGLAFPGKDRSPARFPSLALLALDVLEMLAVALPDDIGDRVVVVASPAQPTKKTKAKSRSAAAAAAASIGDSNSLATTALASLSLFNADCLLIDEDVLTRNDRRGLCAVLVGLMADATRRGNSGAGAGGIGSTTTDGNLRAPFLTALAEVVRSITVNYDMHTLPIAPSPHEVLRQAAGAGIRRCGLSSCNNLEGPGETALVPKRCSRCKAVYYCSGDCQLAHWRAGHKEECGRAAPTGAAAPP